MCSCGTIAFVFITILDHKVLSGVADRLRAAVSIKSTLLHGTASFLPTCLEIAWRSVYLFRNK